MASLIVGLIGEIDAVVALLVALLGIAIGLWFTRVFWIDQSTGQATTLFSRVRVGVLFILTGAVPGAIQTLAFNPAGGVLTMASFFGGFGAGLILGYFLPQRSLAQDVFLLALSTRIRMGAGNPTPMEVFAFSNKVGPEKAQKLLGLDDGRFSTSFALGTAQLGLIFATAEPLDVAVMLDAICGVPATMLARDYDLSVRQVVLILAKL